MPLSKARNRERMRLDRVQPKTDAPQSKSSPIKTLLNRTAPPCVQPKLPWYAGAGDH